MTSTTPRIIQLGDASITIMNAGDMMVNMGEEMDVPEKERRRLYGSTLEGHQPFPSQCVHIALADASILVDINNYALAISLDPSYLPPNYSPPPDVIEQLLTQRIRPEDITHLVITHAHFDHYSGTTIARDGSFSPSFPKARVFLGRADWDNAGTQDALRDPDSLDSHTLAVLHQRGVLELVDGNLDLTSEVRILAAPGESPGHQIVRVHSQGQTIYCLGDLFHHPCEVEQTAWMVKWADAITNLASRERLIEAALQEHALLVAAHMPVGRVEGSVGNPRWVAV